MDHSPPALTLCCLLLGLSSAAFADDAQAEAKGFEFFEKSVRPLLVEHCFDCHSADNIESKLRLDSLAGMLRGGTRGPAIVPGDPQKSLMILAVNHGELLQMPPKEKLSAIKIAHLTDWVKMGAPWPGAEPFPSRSLGTSGDQAGPLFSDDQKKFWAFQPPTLPPLPHVKDEAWVTSPIDRFILAELEKAGLKPAPPADKRTLIRRATFDLTGLPPTPEEIAAFLADDAPEAFARVVDRLLASPRYGEKWGRHWLDVVRYADSNGLDENLAYANAFRYRDYVIDSFNRDKPFDRFVQEQIAGDLLSARDGESQTEQYERLIATAFLSLGPKMLAEDDPVKMQMDIIDEQVDTLGRAFLGLTLGCARCHDHKFDPVPTADYYSLAGIFKSTKTMENHSVVAVWHEYTIATPQEEAALKAHEEQIKAKEAQLAGRTQAARHEFLDAERAKAGKYLQAAARYVNFDPSAADDVKQRFPKLSELTDLKPHATPGDEPTVPGIILIEAEDYTRGTILKRPPIVQNGGGGDFFNEAEYDVDIPADGNYQLDFLYACGGNRKFLLSINGQTVNENAANQATGGFGNDQVKWFPEAVVNLQKGQATIRIEETGPTPHLDKIALVPTELPPTVVLQRLKQNPQTPQQAAKERQLNVELLQQWIRYLQSVNKSDGTVWQPVVAAAGAVSDELAGQYQQRFDAAALAWKQHHGSGEAKEGDKLADAGLDPYRIVLFAASGPYRLPQKPERLYSAAAQREIRTLEEEKKQLEKEKPQLPRAMGVREAEVVNVPIHLRGSHITLGREVPRQFLQIISGEEQSPLPKETSGRLQLAEWLTSAGHPLTARVMINRLWQWHFGSGLVRTPDNFGRLGERPTNQPLLDWLALEFVDNNWSMKEMHRRMMLSSMYRMSARYDAAANAADPENRLWWRFNRRRMQAEEVRDTVMALGSTLDLTMHGQLMQDGNRAYVTGTGSKQTDYSGMNRRSVYLPILRSAVYQVLEAFDFADPSVPAGQRQSTTVAPQALFMMNSEVVAQNADAMAAQLLARLDLDDAGRLRLAFERVYGRLPDAAETGRFLAFTRSIEGDYLTTGTTSDAARQKSWRSLCRVLIASNEFVYIE